MFVFHKLYTYDMFIYSQSQNYRGSFLEKLTGKLSIDGKTRLQWTPTIETLQIILPK